MTRTWLPTIDPHPPRGEGWPSAWAAPTLLRTGQSRGICIQPEIQVMNNDPAVGAHLQVLIVLMFLPLSFLFFPFHFQTSEY